MTICFDMEEGTNRVRSLGTVKGNYIPIQNSITIEVNDNFDWEKKYKYEDGKLEITT